MKYHINLETTDNGWILRWHKIISESELYKDYSASVYPRPRVKTEGTELFTDKAKLLKRLKELL